MTPTLVQSGGLKQKRELEEQECIGQIVDMTSTPHGNTAHIRVWKIGEELQMDRPMVERKLPYLSKVSDALQVMVSTDFFRKVRKPWERKFAHMVGVNQSLGASRPSSRASSSVGSYSSGTASSHVGASGSSAYGSFNSTASAKSSSSLSIVAPQLTGRSLHSMKQGNVHGRYAATSCPSSLSEMLATSLRSVDSMVSERKAGVVALMSSDVLTVFGLRMTSLIEESGFVTRVTSGVEFDLETPFGIVPAKLFGVDCPRPGTEPNGHLSLISLTEMIDQKEIVYRVRFLRGDRVSVDVHIGHSWAQSLLVESGAVWVDRSELKASRESSPEFLPQGRISAIDKSRNAQLETTQSMAMDNRFGVWSPLSVRMQYFMGIASTTQMLRRESTVTTAEKRRWKPAATAARFVSGHSSSSSPPGARTGSTDTATSPVATADGLPRRTTSPPPAGTVSLAAMSSGYVPATITALSGATNVYELVTEIRNFAIARAITGPPGEKSNSNTRSTSPVGQPLSSNRNGASFANNNNSKRASFRHSPDREPDNDLLDTLSRTTSFRSISSTLNDEDMFLTRQSVDASGVDQPSSAYLSVQQNRPMSQYGRRPTVMQDLEDAFRGNSLFPEMLEGEESGTKLVSMLYVREPAATEDKLSARRPSVSFSHAL
jgi:hypothetical protein